MPQLIERGHVYIGQPPLFKVKRGKQEQYVKDELGLNTLLLQSALDDAQLHVNAAAPPISGEALEELARRYNAVMAALDRLARRYDRAVLERMLFVAPFSETDHQHAQQLQAWFSTLLADLKSDLAGAARYQLRIEADENSGYQAILERHVHGSILVEHYGFEFFTSAEYRSLHELALRLHGLLDQGAFIQRGERRQAVSTFKEVMEWLLSEARKGISIQRYKGLGEMNPEQLWETTMNAQTRRLLQVQIEDAIRADEIFTTLMGDQVEPRREFIESNALAVSNLDI
ncbi:hypothetical protein [Thiorhodospira sibirica]|uniref:hypothetical protein n=1 Tax=Thiorhodospira sibirica TaxID=154347 RepID=UPI003AB996BB